LWAVQQRAESSHWLDNGDIVLGLKYNYGHFYEWKDYAAAEKLLRAAVAIEDYNPNYWSCMNEHLLLGDLYKQLGQINAARQQYEAALAWNQKLLDSRVLSSMHMGTDGNQKSRIAAALKELDHPRAEDSQKQ
jgi:tetratricopeptide (TPR) repeat protein